MIEYIDDRVYIDDSVYIDDRVYIDDSGGVRDYNKKININLYE